MTACGWRAGYSKGNTPWRRFRAGALRATGSQLSPNAGVERRRPPTHAPTHLEVFEPRRHLHAPLAVCSHVCGAHLQAWGRVGGCWGSARALSASPAAWLGHRRSAAQAAGTCSPNPPPPPGRDAAAHLAALHDESVVVRLPARVQAPPRLHLHCSRAAQGAGCWNISAWLARIAPYGAASPPAPCRRPPPRLTAHPAPWPSTRSAGSA